MPKSLKIQCWTKPAVIGFAIFTVECCGNDQVVSRCPAQAKTHTVTVESLGNICTFVLTIFIVETNVQLHVYRTKRV